MRQQKKYRPRAVLYRAWTITAPRSCGRLRLLFIDMFFYIAGIRVKAAQKGGRKLLSLPHVKGRNGAAQTVGKGGGGIVGQPSVVLLRLTAQFIVICDQVVAAVVSSLISSPPHWGQVKIVALYLSGPALLSSASLSFSKL